MDTDRTSPREAWQPSEARHGFPVHRRVEADVTWAQNAGLPCAFALLRRRQSRQTVREPQGGTPPSMLKRQCPPCVTGPCLVTLPSTPAFYSTSLSAGPQLSGEGAFSLCPWLSASVQLNTLFPWGCCTRAVGGRCQPAVGACPLASRSGSSQWSPQLAGDWSPKSFYKLRFPAWTDQIRISTSRHRRGSDDQPGLRNHDDGSFGLPSTFAIL